MAKKKKNEVYIPETQNIEKVSGMELYAGSFSNYTKYILLNRAIPDNRDGLKPVHRRILYAMYMAGNTSDKAHRKSAKAVGDIMGNYHPHGDLSIYEAMIRLGKSWIVNTQLIDTQGNNGSIDGDAPSAMRYTESRLTKIVSDFVLEGIKKKGIVPMTRTYDDKGLEPVIVPTLIPIHLVNGTSGIAEGYSTSILPHNLTEIMKALIEINSKVDITDEELFDIVPSPDFPTGGVITGSKYYLDAMKNGTVTNKKNRMYLRVKYRITDTGIDITEIPYGVTKISIVNKLRDLCVVDKKDTKKFQGIEEVIDLSDREGILIRITVDKNVDKNLVLAYLLNKNILQQKVSCNNVVILDGKPQQVSLKAMLKDFNDNRREVLIKELNYDLNKLQNSLHIVEGFVRLSDNLEEILAVIKNSEGKKDAQKKLVDQFNFSEIQAESIVSIALHRISKADKEKYLKEKKEMEKEITYLESLLTSKTKLKNYMNRQYEEVIKNYGTERKTQLIEDEEVWEISLEETISEEDVFLGVSKLGYVKRSTPRSFNTTDKPDLLDGDSMLIEGQYTTKDVLMVFTNLGNYTYIPLFTLDESKWKPVGKHLGTIVNLSEGEEVVSAVVVNPVTDLNKLILTVKSDGKVKTTTVGEHVVAKRFSSTFPCVKIRNDEKLLHASLIDESKEPKLGFVLINGKSMHFNVSEITPKGLRTEGMRGVSLKEDGTEIIEKVIFTYDDKELEGIKLKNRGARPTK